MSTHVDHPRFTCALGGALSAITALPRVIPIIHGSGGCGGNLHMAHYAGSGFYGAGYCGGTSLPGSNIVEHEVVFGGSERLSEQIRTTAEIMDGDLYVVVTACMTDIIGDDIHAVVQEHRANGLPVIGIETGGFKGNSYQGYDLLLEGLFRHYLQPAPVREERLVNLWGLVPGQDPFFRGDLLELKRLLGLLGLRVNTFFAPDETLDNLRSAPVAAANLVVSRTYGVAPARVFEERFGTPFRVVDLPVGAVASARFLREVAAFLGLDSTAVEAVIAREEALYYRILERSSDFFTDVDMQFHSVVVGNATTTLPVTRFLNEELGWLTDLAVVSDAIDERFHGVVAEGSDRFESGYRPTVVFETDAGRIPVHLARVWPPSNGDRYAPTFTPAYVLGSTLEGDLAAAIGARHLGISYPLNSRVVLARGYAGYGGGLNLVEDLMSAAIPGR